MMAVFFTHGVSLELWEKRGMFSREVKFYQALAEKGGEVWFFTYGYNDSQYADRLGEHIHVFSKRLQVPNLLYGFLLPFCFWNQLKTVRLVRIHQMAGAIPALITHWLLHKPLIVRCGFEWAFFLHRQNASRLKQLIVNFLERTTCNAAKAIIITTKKDAEYISNFYGIAREKITVIPNYVDTELFKPLDVEKKPGSICFVGRFEAQKNLENLIEAVSQTNAKLIFYGDGSLKETLKQKAASLGVELSMRGKIPNEDLPKALNACEIFILSSLYEGNPKVLLEAMACGMPVIGTRVEGITSIIEHNVNGILCETSTQSIKEAIEQLLRDQATLHRLGKAARETVLVSSSLSRAMDTELKILNTLGV